MQNNHNHGYDDGDYTYEQNHYEEAPDPNRLDPAVERVRRKLMRLMIVSVTITLLLVIAVFIAVIYKATRTPDNAPTTQVNQPAVPNDLSVVPLNDPAGQAAVGQNTVESNHPVTLPATINREIDLPVGTRILSHSLSGDLISLETLAPSGGTELVIYNYKQGNVVARLPIPANDMPSPELNNN
ncbi:hypothetical protein [Bartonella sp. HY761]|uniref:hypothetical protein n=1 Tax=Bartonella sp. HY761 TaxID=2979330 RepID=UPI00220F0357|nr:hypothetical protein [Bartonella sp. HY761]UXN06394.1 hypothetical protein N6A79_14230 [Bartonella sp. HY761]